MQKFLEVDNGNPDGTAKDAIVGVSPGTNYKSKVWNDNLFNLFKFVESQGYSLIDDDLSQISKASKALYNPAFLYNTSAVANQTVNDIVLGSDGVFYEADADGINADDPVGSVTGNWKIYDIKNIDTIEEILLIPIGIKTINTRGYNSVNDGGGGILNYDSTVDKATANGSTIIDPDKSLALQGTGIGTGCWVRQIIIEITPEMAGAIGDGSSDDTAELLKALEVGVLKLPNKSFLHTGLAIVDANKISSDNSGTLVGDDISIANTIAMYMSNLKMVGSGSESFTLDFRDEHEFLRLRNLDVLSNGFSILIKPSLAGNSTECKLFDISGNLVRGNGTDTDLGISLDGDCSFGIVSNNIVSDIQRQANLTRLAHAFALAGALDDIPVNECRAVFFSFNVAENIRGNGYHVEDINPQTSVLFNISTGVEQGIEVINDHIPFMHNYIGNAVHAHTDQGIYVAGLGSSDSINISFNLIDGSDATQTQEGMLIGQVDSKNSNVLGNIIANQTLDGLEVQSGGGITISHNIFKNIGGNAIVGRSTTGGLNTGTLIESNNKFDTITGNIIDAANAATLIGDNEIISDEIDGDLVSSQVMFVAQRAGIITTITRVATSAGGGGSVNGNYTLKIAGGVTIDTRSIVRTAAQYDVSLFKPSSFTSYEFAKGDVIILETDGAGDATSLVKVQMEWFYYN